MIPSLRVIVVFMERATLRWSGSEEGAEKRNALSYPTFRRNPPNENRAAVDQVSRRMDLERILAPCLAKSPECRGRCLTYLPTGELSSFERLTRILFSIGSGEDYRTRRNSRPQLSREEEKRWFPGHNRKDKL